MTLGVCLLRPPVNFLQLVPEWPDCETRVYPSCSVPFRQGEYSPPTPPPHVVETQADYKAELGDPILSLSWAYSGHYSLPSPLTPLLLVAQLCRL